MGDSLGAFGLMAVAVGIMTISNASAEDLSINAPSRTGFVTLNEPGAPIDVHTEGWACGGAISDNAAFDHADMARFDALFRLYDLHLKGLADMREQFFADRVLAFEVMAAVDKRILEEPYFDADAKAIGLVGRYEADGPITPEDAARFHGLRASPKGAGGTINGPGASHPAFIGSHAGEAPGSVEVEFGLCYEMSGLVTSLARLGQLAASLREAIENVRATRAGILPVGAGS